MSCTVTLLVQVLVLPLLSVTLKVTVFEPTLLQVKLVGLAAKLAMPQASFEPLSTSLAVIVALPDASS